MEGDRGGADQQRSSCHWQQVPGRKGHLSNALRGVVQEKGNHFGIKNWGCIASVALGLGSWKVDRADGVASSVVSEWWRVVTTSEECSLHVAHMYYQLYVRGGFV